jgi:hypothetical protein
MRPIPAPRLGDSHGLLRAMDKRGRLRLDEFVTEFSSEELFPPGLENALGRTRQFVSYCRSAGLVKEDRGVVELTDLGKRYVRAEDSAQPWAVGPAQAEWLRRQLREKHMTDSIFHGAAVALSLYASNPPASRVSTLDFGRALNHLGRAGWDNENTFETQAERYTTLLADLELIDDERKVTAVGSTLMNDLTLPVHMSLPDVAAQLNPGGAEAVRAEGEAEWQARHAPPAPEPAPDYIEAAPRAAAEPPAPPADLWETRAYQAAAPPPPAAPAQPPPAPAAEPEEEEDGFMTFAGAAVRPQDPSAPAPPPPEAPPVAEAPPAPSTNGHRVASDFLPADSIRAAAEEQGLRLSSSVYAGVAAALASRRHVIISGPPGSGKTGLALAVAKAAVAAGRSQGAALVTAGSDWAADSDVLGAAERDRWLIVDEIDRADLDKALGGLSGFLAGLPFTGAAGEATAPATWRLIATAEAGGRASGAMTRRFARIELPRQSDEDVNSAIDAAAQGDATAAAAVKRLVGLREVRALGSGPFVDATRHAAERNAIQPADESQLARESYTAYLAPLLAGLDEDGRHRLAELTAAAL